MAKDLFGGLGGLMKGFSSFMPQDDPATKILNAENELGELKDRKNEVYAEIGQKAIGLISQRPEYAPLISELQLLDSNISRAEERLRQLKSEKDQAELQKNQELAKRTCNQCGTENPDGTKFCQNCGSRLGVSAKNICQGCGADNPAGVTFCGECGARMPNM